MADDPEGKRAQDRPNGRGGDSSSLRAAFCIRVIGIGNDWRGDDAVGLVAARRVSAMIGGSAEVIECRRGGVELLEQIQGASVLLLIDAARSGKPPGTIHRLDPSTGPIAPVLSPGSSHALGVSEAIELARSMGLLPPRVIVFGIEGERTDAGQGLSPRVARALPDVIGMVRAEIERGACTSSI